MYFNTTTLDHNNSKGMLNAELSKFTSNGESVGQALKLSLLISVIAVFIFLISRDIVKALKRRAHWIPGDFLVLSAFTIQLLNLLSSQGEPLDVNPGKEMSWNELWMVHTSRVMLCVIVAYLMPAMADPRAEESWGNLMALALTIFLHVSFEYYFVRRHAQSEHESYYCTISGCFRQDKIPQHRLYILFATLISLCFVMLLLLLGCANIAGRGIERILAQKIPLLVKDPMDMNSESGEKATEAQHYHSCCRTVKNAVLTMQNRQNNVPHDHSCWETVIVAVQRVNMDDEDHRQTCLDRVEDVVQRAVREKVGTVYQHSYWRTVDDALLRAEKMEDEHHHRHCQHYWRMVEEAVLRKWIIAHAYSLEYIIARSALVSSAAIIVTAQIVIIIIRGVQFKVILSLEDIYRKLRFTATVLQCVFILIGWLMIEWRWLTVVVYYRKWEKDTWRRAFRLEDFWTRHLRELLQAQEPKLRQEELLDSKISRIIAKEQITFTVPRQLLYVVIGLQWVMVVFSKACWLASLMIFHNKLIGKLLLFILSKHDMHALEDYKKYEEILKGLEMLRRSLKSLWVANCKSITKANNLILQGNEDGEFMFEILLDFLAKKRSGRGLGLSYLEPSKPQTGLNFLCKKRPIRKTQQAEEERDVEKQPPQQEENWSLAVEEHFVDMGMKSWKMTAVSLLSIIVHLAPIYAELDKEHCSTSHDFPPKAITNCMEAYSQAWEIADFVEETDTESNFNISKAADTYFNILQRKLKKERLLNSKFRHATPQCVRAALEDLKKECKIKTEPPRGVNMISAVIYALGVKQKEEKVGGHSNRWEHFGGNDSFDWKAATYGNAVYKLCSNIQFDDEADMKELLKELESCLADIINECLEKFQYLLLFNSNKWARNSDEKRMGKALYTTGKARLVMQKLVMKGKKVREGTNVSSAIVPI